MTNASSEPASEGKLRAAHSGLGQIELPGTSEGQRKPSSDKSFWRFVPLSRCPAPPEILGSCSLHERCARRHERWRITHSCPGRGSAPPRGRERRAGTQELTRRAGFKRYCASRVLALDPGSGSARKSSLHSPGTRHTTNRRTAERSQRAKGQRIHNLLSRPREPPPWGARAKSRESGATRRAGFKRFVLREFLRWIPGLVQLAQELAPLARDTAAALARDTPYEVTLRASERKRFAVLARALAASTSRSRGGAFATSESSSSCADRAT